MISDAMLEDILNNIGILIFMIIFFTFLFTAVILDEPILGFDSKNKKEFISLIRILKNRYKKTIIIATNDVDFLHKCVDKVIVLQDGKIVMQGNKYEIFCNTKELKKYGILAPKIISFSDKVKNKKNIKIGYRDDINDLIKDIFRNI